ncbi:LppU/SCO3897 family protein [Lentzea aerocolonigenes]|uniref:LppU/SCO3897 family protein n=1 Tax=Lentzea aerocolonigenes TaxID=68170 RepID=UPI000750E22E|nr:hypothetical protein [Lentzea aerocolonigenes]
MIDEPPAPRTSLGKRILTYAATLVVAAIAIYGLSEFLTPIQKPKQGDCANVTGFSNKPNFDAVSCLSSSANYVVTGTVAKSASCANAYADMITRRGPEIRICLAPLWGQGECYPSTSPRMELEAVDCASGNDVFRVTAVSREVPAPSCAAGEEAFTYPEVRLAYCTATP